MGCCGGVVGECFDLGTLCLASANVGIEQPLLSNNEVLFRTTRVTSRLRPRSTGTDMFVAFDNLLRIAK